jgi:hypothetical protein
MRKPALAQALRRKNINAQVRAAVRPNSSASKLLRVSRMDATAHVRPKFDVPAGLESSRCTVRRIPTPMHKLTVMFVATAATLPGCANVGPKRSPIDRADYGAAIADSWNQQIPAQ